MSKYYVVEKKNHNAVHAICDCLAEANNWVYFDMPRYIKLGYFSDKSLTADSFEIVNK